MPSRPSWKNLATLQAAALLFLSLLAALLFRTGRLLSRARFHVGLPRFSFFGGFDTNGKTRHISTIAGVDFWNQLALELTLEPQLHSIACSG
jgi:hypothetical protein